MKTSWLSLKFEMSRQNSNISIWEHQSILNFCCQIYFIKENYYFQKLSIVCVPIWKLSSAVFIWEFEFEVKRKSKYFDIPSPVAAAAATQNWNFNIQNAKTIFSCHNVIFSSGPYQAILENIFLCVVDVDKIPKMRIFLWL